MANAGIVVGDCVVVWGDGVGGVLLLCAFTVVETVVALSSSSSSSSSGMSTKIHLSPSSAATAGLQRHVPPRFYFLVSLIQTTLVSVCLGHVLQCQCNVR